MPRSIGVWPMHGFDAALVAQTYPGRPMTTHHVLEIDRAVAFERWQDAVVAWATHFRELCSVVVLEPAMQRLLLAVDVDLLCARVELDGDGSPAAQERWINRPIDPQAPYPFRIRIAPGPAAAQSVTLSLHHSVTDGRGAMMLFDALLQLVQGATLPARPHHPVTPPTPRASWPTLWRRALSLRRPSAALHDVVDSTHGGHGVHVQTLDPVHWRAVTERARACAVTRNTVLWHTAASTVAAMRLVGGDSGPVRVLAAVDLRARLGVGDDELRNWIGTIEHEHDLDGSPAGLRRLGAALRARARVTESLATPLLLAALVERLPLWATRRVFEYVDSARWPNTHTMLFSHIRPRAPHCWPLALQPRRLWCTSLLPRKPALGMTLTTVGERVTIAASWPAQVLRRATVEDFVARWCSAMSRCEPDEQHARRGLSA